ncbi:signal peptidase I [Salirhabdus euzebyi]|uniref:Signal peptidase I n=1 Tax=Salirhabdus euzebyi TaxID=394506 RepID=A0A841Q3H4_9BACI|nr:signal peptidase I [Salirhabdus euzebyi]MBB6452944.1 signal peptidase I [Salirhabdus euzebyi]
MTLVRELISWIKVIIIAIGVAFLIRTFLFTPIVVEGPSMLPTLESNDHMVVNKFSYRFSEPKRFDIIVFHSPEKSDYIKRIIGLPGEHIAYKDEILYVDGQAILEPFIKERLEKLMSPSHYTHDFRLEEVEGGYEVIPDGHVFVLGDNRTNSTDSRFIGPVPYDQIVGKAQLVYWPFKHFRIVQ